MSFHSTLTPFLGEDATEYAPEHETTTGFMNAKFQEVLDNTVANKEVIESINTTLGEEDLSTTSQNVKGAINEVLDNTVANTEAIENIDLSQYTKTYKSLTEINPTFTINTPVKDVILAMEDNSMAMYKTAADNAGVYPTALGTVIITKQSIDRSYVQCSHPTDGIWYTSYHVVMNSDCEWKALVTQTKINITSDMLKNGWTLKSNHNNSAIKTGDEIKINLAIIGGTLTAQTILCEGLPIPNKESILQVQGTDGKMYMAVYKVDGSIVLLNTLTATTFYYIHN